MKKTEELTEAWQRLHEDVARRRKQIDLTLKSQQFFSEATEIEAWMAEKTELLNSSDVGKDEDAAIKLLTKHKVDFSIH